MFSLTFQSLEFYLINLKLFNLQTLRDLQAEDSATRRQLVSLFPSPKVISNFERPFPMGPLFSYYLS